MTLIADFDEFVKSYTQFSVYCCFNSFLTSLMKRLSINRPLIFSGHKGQGYQVQGIELFESTTLAIEYTHDEDYDAVDGGTGDSADIITVQLAAEF